MTNQKLAILITCHNRQDTTLTCLKALKQQDLASKFDVYLTDDGSTDSTVELIKARYPEVNILRGNGSLFWGGGTRLAFAQALKYNYDYYIWLNDDTVLKPNALDTLLEAHHQLLLRGEPNSIIAGSMQDLIAGNISYGGKVANSWRPLKFGLLEPNAELQECQTANGNLLLIPRSVAVLVGNIDEAFPHSLGDIDYGLRARQLGCSVWIAPGYLGTCARNPIKDTWQDTNLPLTQRLLKLFSLKGSSPLRRETWLYARRHGGWLWLLVWLRPYLNFIYSVLFQQFATKKLKRN